MKKPRRKIVRRGIDWNDPDQVREYNRLLMRRLRNVQNPRPWKPQHIDWSDKIARRSYKAGWMRAHRADPTWIANHPSKKQIRHGSRRPKNSSPRTSLTNEKRMPLWSRIAAKFLKVA